MKKKQLFIPLFLFVLLTGKFLPLIDVQGVTHDVGINNPSNYESFSYYENSELFDGYSITQGLTPDIQYAYEYTWKIDGVTKDWGASSGWTSEGGVLYLITGNFYYLVNPMDYSVGEHTVQLGVIIIDGSIYEKHIHTWFREDLPPVYVPSIDFTTPAIPSTSYNYTLEGTSYTVGFDLEDVDDDVDTMNLYLDDVLQKTWSSPSVGSYSWVVTVDSVKTYIIKINGTDDENNDYLETTYLISYSTGSYIDVLSPSEQYHNTVIGYTIESGSSDGLHNLTYSVENYGYSDTTITSNNADVVMDNIWDYDYDLNNTDYVYSVAFIYGDKYEITSNWYSSSWSHRVPLTITYSAVESYATVNHTITIGDSVYTRDKANGDDWVITQSDGTTVCSHWLESYNAAGDSILWFNATSLSNGDTIYYLYYGNSGASNSENPSNVFDSWDDFDTGYSDDDGLLSSRGWSTVSGTPKVEDIGTSSMVMELEVDDSGGTNDQISNVFDSALTNLMVHYDIYLDMTFGGQWYTDCSESATSIMLSRIDNDDGSWKYYVSSYTEFNPVVDISDTTWYKYDYLITGSDVDLYINTTNHDGVLRNTPSVGVDTFTWKTSDTNDGDLTVYIDNFWVYSFLSGMLASTGSEQVRLTLDNSITIVEDGYTTGISQKGNSTWGVDFTASKNTQCDWVNITVVVYDTIFNIYTSSTETVQTDSFTLNSTAWDTLSDGWFNVNISTYDDNDDYFSTNITYYKDTSSPTFTIISPRNSSEWFISQTPSLNYYVNWSENQGESNNRIKFELNYNESNGLTVVWILGEDVPLNFPTCRDKIVNSFGEYYCRLIFTDSAGNSNQSDVFYFDVYNERTISISATALDSSSLDIGFYLQFYVDGMLYSYEDIVVRTDTFDFVIVDIFGNELYSNDIESYASTKSFSLPLRPFTLTNGLSRVVGYRVIQDNSHGFIEGDLSSSGTETIYLLDGSYEVIASPYDRLIDSTTRYSQISDSLTVSSTSTSHSLNFPIEEFSAGSGGAGVNYNIIIGMVVTAVAVIIAGNFVINKIKTDELKKEINKIKKTTTSNKKELEAGKSLTNLERLEIIMDGK